MKKYHTPKRILLKLSGEALQGNQWYGIDPVFLSEVAKKIVRLTEIKGIEVVLVVWGGNIFRWAILESGGMDRSMGDYMGMLATIINGIALGEAIKEQWKEVRVMSAIPTQRVCEEFIRLRALRHMEKGRVVICVWGVGNPYFTTDSAAVLRALELKCDAIVKATKVDGVYNKDPRKFPDAERYDVLSLAQALNESLGIMDQAAIALAKDQSVPIFVCKMEDIDRIDEEDVIGTFVK